ncbi:MAG TPA: helix-turn-helix domain-containing protein [Thermoanaerobaculia bacterium]|nr:helix-turn-helix domain-containing protein [Thermoanaerobaculia bacterium]
MRANIFSSRDRRRLERAAALYLLACYRSRTAARATEFASTILWTQPYLSRFVAAVTGLSVRNYLRRRQLAYAAYLLRATPMSNREVALASAFGTVATFYRCFLDAYGKTPGAYRREVMKCDTVKEIVEIEMILARPTRRSHEM